MKITLVSHGTQEETYIHKEVIDNLMWVEFEIEGNIRLRVKVDDTQNLGNHLQLSSMNGSLVILPGATNVVYVKDTMQYLGKP